MIRQNSIPKSLFFSKIPLSLFFLSILLFSLLLSFLHCKQQTLKIPENPNSKSLKLTSNPPQNSNPKFKFIIKVLAYDRLDSLSRCLRSLAAAEYDNDAVDLHVFVDHFKGENDTRVLDSKLGDAKRMMGFLDEFEWGFGEKMVHYRSVNVGLQAQWIEAWWPGSDDEFAFVVEDDLELSPLYYRYLKGLIGRYYYDKQNFDDSIYGATLQRPRFVGGKHGNKINLDDGVHIFLYQMVGTWGQLLFPKPWKEFRIWYDEHKAKNIEPILDGMVTTGWYKKMGQRIWTPWFFKFIHSRGYFNIYTNFLQERALSVSHREAGVNYGRRAGPDSKLINNSSFDLDMWTMQPLNSLKWYDFCFTEVHRGRIASTLENLGSLHHSLWGDRSIIFLNAYGTPDAVLRNLLCHFERLDIRNYVILNGEKRLVYDLTRRGHAVIDSEKVFEDIKTKAGLKRLGLEKVDDILVAAFAIKKSIEVGYDAWLINVNMLPIVNIYSSLSTGMQYFATAKEIELSFFKSTSSGREIFSENFLHKLASAPEMFIEKASGKRHLGQIVAKWMSQNGMTPEWIDVSDFGYQITERQVKKSKIGDDKKLVFWESGMDGTAIRNLLDDLELWTIDEELSCISVTCHPT